MKFHRKSLAFLLFLGNLYAQQESFELQKVVVSASGFEQEADVNLRNVLIIQADELEKRAYGSLEQALMRIPNISFVDSGLGRNVDLRGQGSKANVAVKVLLDGKTINVLDNSHGVTPLDSINLDIIDRIEIIPGGGSVLYGNGTRGGVINIITKKQPKDNFSLALKNSFYDRGRLGGNLATILSKKFNENLALYANINGFNKDGFRDGENSKGFFINTKAYFDFEDSHLIFAYDFFESQNTSSGYLNQNQLDNLKQKGTSDILEKVKRPELSLDFQTSINKDLEFKAHAFWQNQKKSYPKNIQLYSGINAYQNGSSFDDTLSSLNLKNKYTYKENSYLSFGYDFSHHKAKRNNHTYYTIPIPHKATTHKMNTLMDMQKQSHALFALDSHQFNSYFSLSSGLRYEYANYEVRRNFSSIWSPTGGISGNSSDSSYPQNLDSKYTNNYALEFTPHFKYSDTGLAYVKFERGFISPTPVQFISKTQSTRGNPYYINDLNSEIYNTYEIGLSDFLWNFYGFSFTLFHTQSKDEITYIGDPHALNGATGDINGFWKFLNLEQTKRYGLELAISQEFQNLTLRQSLSYLNAKLTKGINKDLRIPYVSKIKATASLEYAFNKNLQSFVDLTYFSRAKDGGLVEADSGKISNQSWIKDYFLTDVGLSYALNNFQVFLGVRNLFDEKYFTYQAKNYNARTQTISSSYTPGNGRNYYLEFKYAF